MTDLHLVPARFSIPSRDDERRGYLLAVQQIAEGLERALRTCIREQHEAAEQIRCDMEALQARLRHDGVAAQLADFRTAAINRNKDYITALQAALVYVRDHARGQPDSGVFRREGNLDELDDE